MFKKISKKEIKKIIESVDGVSEKEQDEMAIPSYLHNNPFINYLMWKRYEIIYQMALPLNNKTVCEFGCGIGLFLPSLAPNCEKTYAIDLFPQYAKNLCRNYNLDVCFLNDIEEMPSESIDIIIAADVMEHLDNPKIFAIKFYRKLKSNGKLIVSGPTENIFYKIGRLLAGFGDKGDYHHTNIQKIKSDIIDCGFLLKQIVKIPFKIPPYLFEIYCFQKE